jgi:hypothetical protein
MWLEISVQTDSCVRRSNCTVGAITAKQTKFYVKEMQVHTEV